MAFKNSQTEWSWRLPGCCPFLMYCEVWEPALPSRTLLFCCFWFPFVEASLWPPRPVFGDPPEAVWGRAHLRLLEVSPWRRCDDASPWLWAGESPVCWAVGACPARSLPRSALSSWWMVPFITTLEADVADNASFLKICSACHTSQPPFSGLCTSWQIYLHVFFQPFWDTMFHRGSVPHILMAN